MSGPTPKELQDAGLVVLPEQAAFATCIQNGHPLRRFAPGPEGKGEFPELLVAYGSKDWAKPVTVYPSGIAPPPVAPGFTRSFDDFTELAAGPMWNGVYDGKSANLAYFVGSHVVFKGDSLLRLESYPDPAGLEQCWGYTPELAEQVNQWGGAGIQTVERYPVGTTFTWAGKWDTYPGMTNIVLTMGNDWPPEQDLIECGVGARGDAVTNYQCCFHWADAETQDCVPTARNVDYSEWHLWQAKWTLKGTTLTCDGAPVVTCSFGSSMFGAPNGLDQPQFLGLQVQSGDPGQANPDPSVTAEAPIVSYYDWVAIDVPA